MSILTRLTSTVIGVVRGENAKQKFLYLQQTKKAERRLKNFWQKHGMPALDEMEMKSWHTH